MTRRRTSRWEGFVEDLDETTIWARLVPVDHEGAEIVAEFDRAMCPGLREREYLTLYVHRRSKKTRAVLRPKAFQPLTAEQLAQIEVEAARQATELCWLAA